MPRFLKSCMTLATHKQMRMRMMIQKHISTSVVLLGRGKVIDNPNLLGFVLPGHP